MKPGNSYEVKELFNDLSLRYDFLNDVFSLGLHRVWKQQLLNLLQPCEGETWIDFCCGSGDLTISLAKIVMPGGKVIGIDSASKILSLAKKKVEEKPSLPIKWINKDLFDKSLNIKNYDGAVMAYGLRNLSDPLAGLKVIKSSLKSDGKAGVLDFSRFKKQSFNAWFQKKYLRNLVVPIATNFGLQKHYSYIEDSLVKFPDGDEQKDLAKEAGFSKVKYRKIAGGQMGILLLKN